MTVPLTVLVGNCRAGSRTLGVARQVAGTLGAGLSGEGVTVAEPDVVDLGALGPTVPLRLTDAVDHRHPLRAALELVRRPGLLVVASPTFKGSYTGLLKLFLDMLPQDGLPGTTVAVPVTVAGWPQHRTVVDAHLRQLLTDLGAQVPVRGFSVLETELAQMDRVLQPWAAGAVPVLGAVVRRLAGAGHPAPLTAAGVPAP